MAVIDFLLEVNLDLTRRCMWTGFYLWEEGGGVKASLLCSVMRVGFFDEA